MRGRGGSTCPQVGLVRPALMSSYRICCCVGEWVFAYRIVACIYVSLGLGKSDRVMALPVSLPGLEQLHDCQGALGG